MRSISLILITCHCNLFAQFPGDPDLTFGSHGTTVTPINEYSSIHGLDFGSDGSIIAGGVSENVQEDYSFNLVKFDKYGKVDSSFGYLGIVNLEIEEFRIYSQAGPKIQIDGKIIIAGEVNGPFQDLEFEDQVAVIRFNPDGKIDSTFGEVGFIFSRFNNNSADIIPKSVLLQDDGKILIVGQYSTAFGDDKDFIFILRYNNNGTIDSSYGDAGLLKLQPDFENIGERTITTAHIQPDGKIIVAGSNSNYALLMRINNEGSIDETFGTEGYFHYKYYEYLNVFNDFDLTQNNKILVAGTTDDGDFKSGIMLRLNGDGSIDSTFGQNGIIINDAPFIFLIEQPNGNIFSSPKLTRYTENGDVDWSFGEDGTIYSGDIFINCAESQADGKIVAGGSRDWNFALGRYLSENIADPFNNTLFYIYPNPIANNFSLKFKCPTSVDGVLRIYNMSAQLISEALIPGQIETYNFTAPGNSIKGIYYFEFQIGYDHYSKIAVKM
ncbi:MAG: T9SS type A sorting domain-containing protein [Chitinophagales bacterium]